jgi:glycogen debranching enzyme
MPDKNIKQAIEIAKESLRWCYTERGIITGTRKVLWSWDSFFATFGAVSIGDLEIVKTNLLLYLKYQHKNGSIPKRFSNPLYNLRFIGIPISEVWSKQQPNYKSPYYTGVSLTQHPMLILAFHHYVKNSGDLNFLKQNFSKLQNIYHFLDRHSYKNGLLKESLGGGWAEAVMKRGAVAFTNMCYAESLRCFSDLARIAGKLEISEEFKNKYQQIKTTINNTLWSDKDGGFYSDWRGLNRHHNFASDGNILAILWGIADKNQTSILLKRLDKLMAKSRVPMPVAEDKYLIFRIFIFNLLGGMKHYHINFSWTWLGSIYALAKLKIGRKKEALQILVKISKAIVRDGIVHEIYYNNKPVKLFFYKSEAPWAWSAGLFLYACKMAGLKVK